MCAGVEGRKGRERVRVRERERERQRERERYAVVCLFVLLCMYMCVSWSVCEPACPGPWQRIAC